MHDGTVACVKTARVGTSEFGIEPIFYPGYKQVDTSNIKEEVAWCNMFANDIILIFLKKKKSG